MVVGFAFGAITGIAESLVRTAAAPALDLAQQEVSKLLPTKKTDVNSLIENFRRGEITEEVFYERMSRYAFNKEESDRTLFAAKFFPGAADLTRFVVKEAFSPEIVADLTKGEPVPEQFITEMIKLGATKEIAEWFWTAHYDPLGRRDFEEMFQRLHPDLLKFREEDMAELGLKAENVGVDQEFMKRMYRILDVYPGLRDRLLLIQYSKIPRIDIRRFEDFDILDDDELEFRNREDGRSPSDARKMVLFTKLSNRMKDLRVELRDRAISFEDAVAELVAIGAKPDAAERLINRVKPSLKKLRSQKLINKAIDDILKSVVNENISIEAAKVGLMNLGLDEAEADAEIGMAHILTQGDFYGDDQLDAVVNDIRRAEDLPTKPILDSGKLIEGYNYTLELKDAEGTIVKRFLRTLHQEEEMILDVESGFNAVVIARRQKFVKVLES
jgi:hypothetical protein